MMQEESNENHTSDDGNDDEDAMNIDNEEALVIPHKVLLNSEYWFYPVFHQKSLKL